MIGRINEYKGKQDLNKQQATQILNTLRDVAVIQSTKASNAIEGIVVTESRLHTIMSKTSDPTDRSEAEIAGYRNILNLIYASAQNIRINPNILLQLHKELYNFVPIEGGRWRNVDNEISETFPDGTRRTRFVPVPAFDTPAAMQALCDRLKERRQSEDVDPLILTGMFVLDFLSIHPFNDGNGRMARFVNRLNQKGHVNHLSIQEGAKQLKNILVLLSSLSEQDHYMGSTRFSPYLTKIKNKQAQLIKIASPN